MGLNFEAVLECGLLDLSSGLRLARASMELLVVTCESFENMKIS